MVNHPVAESDCEGEREERKQLVDAGMEPEKDPRRVKPKPVEMARP